MEKNSVKTRIIRGIGLSVIERPRELQKIADTNEHHVVHELYALQKQGLVAYQKKRNLHSPGINLTKIRLTPKGVEAYERLGKPIEQDASTGSGLPRGDGLDHRRDARNP